MKRKVVLLLAAAALLVLAGCSSVVGDGMEQLPDTQPETSFLGVTLSTKDVSPSGLTIVCSQYGGAPTGELSTGSYYSLERLVDGNWTAVDYIYDGSEGEIAWTSEAWIITMDCTTEWPVDWSFLYGGLEAGTYRIGKEIMDFRGPGDYDLYTLYAGFIIE